MLYQSYWPSDTSNFKGILYCKALEMRMPGTYTYINAMFFIICNSFLFDVFSISASIYGLLPLIQKPLTFWNENPLLGKDQLLAICNDLFRTIPDMMLEECYHNLANLKINYKKNGIVHLIICL